jgi:hypothetical protein
VEVEPGLMVKIFAIKIRFKSCAKLSFFFVKIDLNFFFFIKKTCYSPYKGYI